MRGQKIPLFFDQQILYLKNLDVIINDDEYAYFILRNISLYRLIIYLKAVKKQNKLVELNFDTLIQYYNFDRELKMLIFDAIERIEIGFRTKLIYYLSHEISPWWFEDFTIFKNKNEYLRTLKAIDNELIKTKESYITEYLNKYKDIGNRPPAWKTIEIASLGNISKLYGNLLPTIKSKDIIAAEFGTVNHTYFPSWIQSITQIRNVCAHHGLLWNKKINCSPKLLKKPPYPWLTVEPIKDDFSKLYIYLCCMKYLLNVINPKNSFTNDLDSLFIKYSSVDKNSIGISHNWKNEPLWLTM